MMKKPYLSGLYLTISLGFFALGYVLTQFASSPWKEWGAIIVLVSASSWLTIRASQDILGNFSMKWLPYVIATFVPLALVGFLTSGIPSIVALSALIAIDGIIAYYWLIAIIVSSAKSFKRDVLGIQERQQGEPQPPVLNPPQQISDLHNE
jgi:hypothetical protein